MGEVVAGAPLCDFEALEALSSLFENSWLEVVGSREVGGIRVDTKPSPKPFSRRGEIAMTVALTALLFGLLVLTSPLRAPLPASTLPPHEDVFERSRWQDIETALEVYRLETGRYPDKLDRLWQSEWVTERQIEFAGYQLEYQCSEDGQSYELSAVAELSGSKES